MVANIVGSWLSTVAVTSRTTYEESLTTFATFLQGQAVLAACLGGCD
jgi:hypothetical protein